MKVSTDPRQRRARRLGVYAALLALAALPGCFFDRSGIVVDQNVYACSATLRAADGTVSEISTSNLVEFAGGGDIPVFATVPGYGDAEERIREQWLRYLRRVLEERSGDEAFRATYGAGPWCVAGGLDVEDTGVVSQDDDLVSDESGPALGTCPCGEECGNDPGVVPVLEVSPASAEGPYHVEFGPVAVGDSRGREVTFANSGPGRLCLTPPAIDRGGSAHPDDFTLVAGSGCTVTEEGSVVLEGPATCRVLVTFTPSAPGRRSARVPGPRGCGDQITLEGTGEAGHVRAVPAEACFATPAGPDGCREGSILIQNGPAASVDLVSVALGGPSTDGWTVLRLRDSEGADAETPHTLGPGDFATQRVRACAGAVGEALLRVTHNGTDDGMPGSPTGDLDPGSPLVVRLLPPASGCTP